MFSDGLSRKLTSALEVRNGATWDRSEPRAKIKKNRKLNKY